MGKHEGKTAHGSTEDRIYREKKEKLNAKSVQHHRKTSHPTPEPARVLSKEGGGERTSQEVKMSPKTAPKPKRQAGNRNSEHGRQGLWDTTGARAWTGEKEKQGKR